MLDVALSRPWLAGRNSNVVISTHFFASVPKHQNSTGSYSVARKRKRDRWQQQAKQQQYKMNSGRTVFPQLTEHLPHKEFHKCVARARGGRYAKNFSSWDNTLRWFSLNSPIARVCGTLRPVWVRLAASCTTWASAQAWR